MTKTATLSTRSCTECGIALSTRNPKALTCGQVCRNARSNRIRAEKAAGGPDPREARGDRRKSAGRAQLVARLNAATEDEIHTVVQDELRPIVRESITDDTLRAIQKLVDLTPAAVEALGQDLIGIETDAEGREYINYDRRQKATALLLRYTVGHQALVPNVDPAPPGINVIFPAMERPQYAASPVGEPVTMPSQPAPDLAPADITQECNACGEIKPLDQFVGRSERCLQCHEKMQARARELEKGIPEGTGGG